MKALEEVRGGRGREERGGAVVELGKGEDAHGEEVTDEGAEGERVDGVYGAVGSVAWGEAALTLLVVYLSVQDRSIERERAGRTVQYERNTLTAAPASHAANRCATCGCLHSRSSAIRRTRSAMLRVQSDCVAPAVIRLSMLRLIASRVLECVTMARMCASE